MGPLPSSTPVGGSATPPPVLTLPQQQAMQSGENATRGQRMTQSQPMQQAALAMGDRRKRRRQAAYLTIGRQGEPGLHEYGRRQYEALRLVRSDTTVARGRHTGTRHPYSATGFAT